MYHTKGCGIIANFQCVISRDDRCPFWNTIPPISFLCERSQRGAHYWWHMTGMDEILTHPWQNISMGEMFKHDEISFCMVRHGPAVWIKAASLSLQWYDRDHFTHICPGNVICNHTLEILWMYTGRETIISPVNDPKIEWVNEIYLQITFIWCNKKHQNRTQFGWGSFISNDFSKKFPGLDNGFSSNGQLFIV